MIPSGCQNPPLKQPPDPSLVDPTISPSLDNPKIDVSPQSGEEHTASLPIPASEGAGKSTYLTNGILSRASPYDRSSSGGATRRKGSRMHRREKPQMESPNFPPNLSPVGSGISDSPKAPVEDALPSQPKGSLRKDARNRKKKQVVVRANTNGLKSNMKNTTVSVDTCKQVAGPSYSNVVGSGFNFARAVQGAKVKPVKPPIQQPLSSSQTPGPGLPRSRSADPPPPVHSSSMEVDTPPGRSNNRFAVLNSISELDPFNQSSGTGTTFSELDIHASIKRTSLVEASSDLYPPDPMNEDGSTAGRFLSDDKDDAAGKGATEKEKLFCQVNREHVEGARLLPNSVLSSPSPGGIHSSNGGKSYGITESQRKAIADRISASSNICIDETVNWCPGEWDYFNDLCISLGLDPDYCIEDVESDTENGTAQFLSGLLKEGCPKSNRKRVSVSRYGDWDSLVAILIWYIRMRFWPLVYARFTIVFWPIMVMAIRMEIRNFGLGANFLVGFIFPGFWACVGALLTYPQYFDFSSWEFRPKFWYPAQFEGPMHGFVFDTCNILFYLLIRKNRLKVGPMGVFFNGHYLKGYWAWSWALQPIVQLKVLPPLEFQPKARISAQIEGPNRGVDIGTYNNLLYLNCSLILVLFSFIMGKNGGGKKKVIQVQPVRQQPPRATRGATGGVPMVDSSRGWNPFTCAPMVNQVEQTLPECLVNRFASTIPSVSPSSNLDRSGFSSLESGVNWSDVVKGLKSGSQLDGVHDFQASPAVSLPTGGVGLFNAGFSSCLVTPVQSPVSLSGSVSSPAAGKSLVEAVTHDVLTPDISVTAGCMGINPSVEPVSSGSDVNGVASSPMFDIPVVAGSPVIISLDNGLSPDVTSPMSAGEDVTAGCTSENPTGHAHVTGPISVGSNCSPGLLNIGVSSGPPFSSVGLNIGNTAGPSLTSVGPFSAGPNQVSHLYAGPVFNCADGLQFNPNGPDNSVGLGANGLTSSGPNCSTDEILFGSVPSISTSDFNFVGANSIATSDELKSPLDI
ncbi:hypothetical protein L1987_56726 [Smallanthus sonchifolius]|uniref:Uncharacterized protein n=1 Tax=Smallanthus sonchifolius TaxID=185202 RepID=A0ACB9EDH2_9ASTR|nr:hypothetical protein L1987_56726 [Smallanthus sonchifolius]